MISTYNIERSYKVQNGVGGGVLCNIKERENQVRIYTHKANSNRNSDCMEKINKYFLEIKILVTLRC